MPVALIDAANLEGQGVLVEGNIFSDKVVETNTFICGHCGRVVFMDPVRKAMGDHRRCHQCGQWTCGHGGCDPRIGCHDMRRDRDRALEGGDTQPWLLRHYGEPVDRIYREDGEVLLVLRKDHNLTVAERERHRGVAERVGGLARQIVKFIGRA